MQGALKKEFTLRISQANRTELTVIILEMAIAYLESAEQAESAETYRMEIARARKCVDELKKSLNFQYEIAGTLLHLYIHINKLLVRAMISRKKDYLSRAKETLIRLKDAFAKVAKEDHSEPMLENTQTVYAGYTYGKTDLNENLDNNSSGRGFLV